MPNEWADDEWLRPVDFQRGLCAWAAWITGDIETRDAQAYLALDDGRFDEYLAVLDALADTTDEEPHVTAMLTDPDECLRMASGFALDQWRQDLRDRVQDG